MGVVDVDRHAAVVGDAHALEAARGRRHVGEGAGDVVLEARELAHAHAFAGVDLVGGAGGAFDQTGDLGLDAELVEGRLKPDAHLLRLAALFGRALEAALVALHDSGVGQAERRAVVRRGVHGGPVLRRVDAGGLPGELD